MKTNKSNRAAKAFEKTLDTRPTGLRRAEMALATQAGKYILRLFVAGATNRSRQAILRVRQLCEAQPKGSCTLEVIDIYQQPDKARKNQIVATPTLIIKFPPPLRRFIGNLTNITGLFIQLDLITKRKTAV